MTGWIIIYSSENFQKIFLRYLRNRLNSIWKKFDDEISSLNSLVVHVFTYMSSNRLLAPLLDILIEVASA